MWWNYPLKTGKTIFQRGFLFQRLIITNPSIFWTLSRFNAYEFVQTFVLFLSTHMLIFVVNIRQARTFWNSTHCLLSPFTLDWSRNVLHNPMWNMAVNNISYSIYPLSARTEKGYITKIIPFFFCSVYFWLTAKNIKSDLETILDWTDMVKKSFTVVCRYARQI